MGTDRSKVYEGPCQCGKGTFEVDFCQPDHGWPTSNPYWYETRIRCSDCVKEFELNRQSNRIVVVEKKEIEARKVSAQKGHKIGSDLMKSEKVKKMLDSFEAVLESQKSMAATHRLLTSAGLEHSSLPTFRKNWRGAKSWIKSYVFASSLDKVLKLLNLHDQEILDVVSKIEQLWEESRTPLPHVGEAIYDIKD